jgi:uncharacterized protein YdeI (YjbR/CyaY-like superfamily)
MNNESVDSFLTDGCGRCDHYRTPACKVLLWTAPLVALRALVREVALTEDMKWGHPTYSVGGHNVVMLNAFKDRCTLSFLDGSSLRDDGGLLELPGPNTQHGRLIAFRSLAEVEARAGQIRDLLAQAVARAESGARPAPRADAEPIPAELEERLLADPALHAAFEALTPGRRRSHVLHVSGAKASATRARRVEQCVPKILAGLGYLDRPGR